MMLWPRVRSTRLAMERLMFFLKFDMLFAGFKQAKQQARKLNRRRHSDADPRELLRMRAELEAAREHVRLMSVVNRNRMF
jgi:hypothetical protein